MTVMAESRFLAESIAAVAAAETRAELHETYARRTAALVLDHGTLRDARHLARAWQDRDQQLLGQAIEEGDRP